MNVRRRRNKGCSLGIKALVYTLSFLLVFPAWADSVKFRLTERLKFRVSDSDGVLNAMTVLPQGTVLEIPEAFVPKEFRGASRDEVALLTWLKLQAGEGKQFSLRERQADGEMRTTVKQDFFASVKVVSAPGSPELEGTFGHVAIRHLAKGDGLRLIAVEETPFANVMSPDEAVRYLQEQQAKAKLYEAKLKEAREAQLAEALKERSAGAAVPEPARTDRTRIPGPVVTWENARVYLCQQLSLREHGSALSLLENDLQRVLDKIRSTHDRRVTTSFKSPTGVAREVQTSCGRSDFESTVARAARNNLVPPELMFSMMHAESSGRCTAVNYEGNGSISVGLFQINDKSSRKSFCGPSVPHRFDNPECLENPETNLSEALRIMRAKYRSVNGQNPPPLKPWANMSARERDYWRKALAAYNGGEGYVYQAYNDIQSFNERNGTNLDPQDWGVRRLFFFRSELGRNASNYFSNRYKYKRGTNNAISNVVHTESILGTEPGTRNSTRSDGLITRWTGYLRDRSIYP